METEKTTITLSTSKETIVSLREIFTCVIKDMGKRSSFNGTVSGRLRLSQVMSPLEVTPIGS